MQWDEVFARVMARYWADFLREGARPSALRDAGYGEEGAGGFVRGAMIDVLIADLLPGALSLGHIGLFEDALFHIILREFRTELPPHTSCILRTDYGPCKLIDQAASSVGISDKLLDLRFPWKTTSWLDENGVRVRRGNDPIGDLVITKRRALYLKTSVRIWQQLPPNPDYKDPLYDEACRQERQLYAIAMPVIGPFPSGRFDDLVDQLFAFCKGNESSFQWKP